jgi:hypothetical protein
MIEYPFENFEIVYLPAAVSMVVFASFDLMRVCTYVYTFMYIRTCVYHVVFMYAYVTYIRLC